jgi:hypothetical protein
VSIGSAELAGMVRQAKACSLPSEADRLEIMVDRIERTGITARLDSPQSLWLREIVETHRAYILPEVAGLLSDVDLYGVDLEIIDANPRQSGGRRQIIVFSGLIRIVRYYAQLTRVLYELPINRPGRMFRYDGAERPEAAAFSDAAMSIMADYLISGSAPPRLDPLLAPRAQAHAENGCIGALLFVLLHELGHLKHGHLRDGFERFERPRIALLLDEAIDEYQNAEFQADQFAYLAFAPEIREVMMSSVLFFLGPHSFLEAFARGSDSHPFAINRAGQMAGLIPQTSETGRIVADIARKRAEGYRNLAARRELGGGDIRFRIHETLPVDEAHAIIAGITRRVLSETGPLEAAE